jgi:hypothetical protein
MNVVILSHWFLQRCSTIGYVSPADLVFDGTHDEYDYIDCHGAEAQRAARKLLEEHCANRDKMKPWTYYNGDLYFSDPNDAVYFKLAMP